MSKQRIIEGIDAMFQNMRTPSPLMHAVERQVCIQSREFEHAWIKREVASVFEQRDELLAALKAAMRFIDAHVADPDITNEMCQAWESLQRLNPRAAIAKAEGGQDE